MRNTINKTRNHFRLLFLFFLAVFLPLSTPALDWGLITDHTVTLEGVDNAVNDVRYQALLVPWLSALVGKSGDLYISAAFNAVLENKEWTLIPELYQTTFSWDFGNGELRLGRMPFSDPLGLIISGFFDGVSCGLDTSAGTFSLGAWYTGLLYKKTANINITEEDIDSYYETLSYNKFSETYFASRRLAYALGWEHPGIAEIVRLKLAVLGQADLNGRDTKFHSEYLAARAGLPLGDYFVLDLGGALGLAEAADEFRTSLAAELGVSCYLPTALQDRLKFTGIFSGGLAGGIYPFIPITTQAQGDILKAKISGLSLLCLDYTARVHQSFSFSVSSIYFVLSDLGTYQGWPGKKDGYFLGNEFFGKLIWSPVSDFQLNLGGGLFIPSMGNADPNAGLKWKVELNAVLAIL